MIENSLALRFVNCFSCRVRVIENSLEFSIKDYVLLKIVSVDEFVNFNKHFVSTEDLKVKKLMF